MPSAFFRSPIRESWILWLGFSRWSPHPSPPKSWDLVTNAQRRFVFRTQNLDHLGKGIKHISTPLNHPILATTIETSRGRVFFSHRGGLVRRSECACLATCGPRGGCDQKQVLGNHGITQNWDEDGHLTQTQEKIPTHCPRPLDLTLHRGTSRP